MCLKCSGLSYAEWRRGRNEAPPCQRCGRREVAVRVIRTAGGAEVTSGARGPGIGLHDKATYPPYQDRIDPVGLGPGDESASTRSPSTPSTEPCARRRSASQHVVVVVVVVIVVTVVVCRRLSCAHPFPTRRLCLYPHPETLQYVGHGRGRAIVAGVYRNLDGLAQYFKHLAPAFRDVCCAWSAAPPGTRSMMTAPITISTAVRPSDVARRRRGVFMKRDLTVQPASRATLRSRPRRCGARSTS